MPCELGVSRTPAGGPGRGSVGSAEDIIPPPVPQHLIPTVPTPLSSLTFPSTKLPPVHRNTTGKMATQKVPRTAPAKLLCFDVYGTLIDWETGIYTTALPLLSRVDPQPSREQFLNDYAKHEAAQQEKTPDLKYSELLAKVYAQLAEYYNLPGPRPSQEEAEQFGNSVGAWPAFSDSADALKRLREQGLKLVVLSNVDKASFSKSLVKLGGEGTFDRIFTAEEIGCYKPELKGFETVLKEVEERWGVGKEEVRVTAQSLYHDHVPAKKLGLRSVWIDRAGAYMGKKPEEVGECFDLRFETLGGLADALEKGEVEL